MLYKSKAKIVWLVLAALFALSALGLIIAHWVTQENLYLTISTGLATAFFFAKGISDYIDSKYCERRDRKFVRTFSYVFLGCGGVSLIIFLLQLIKFLGQ